MEMEMYVFFSCFSFFHFRKIFCHQKKKGEEAKKVLCPKKFFFFYSRVRFRIWARNFFFLFFIILHIIHTAVARK